MYSIALEIRRIVLINKRCLLKVINNVLDNRFASKKFNNFKIYFIRRKKTFLKQYKITLKSFNEDVGKKN
jgi:hypothetical protein